MRVYIPGTGVRNLGSCQGCLQGLGGFFESDSVVQIFKKYPGYSDELYNGAIRQELEVMRTKDNGLRLINVLTQVDAQIPKITGLRGRLQKEALALRAKYPQLAKAFYVWLTKLYVFKASTHADRYKNNVGYREWWRGQMLNKYHTARSQFDYLVVELDKQLKSNAALRETTKADLASMKKSYWGDLAGYIEKALKNLMVSSVVAPSPVPTTVPSPTPIKPPSQTVDSQPSQAEIEARYQADPEFRMAWLTLQDSLRQKNQGLEFIAGVNRLNERIKQDAEYRKFVRSDLMSMWKTHPELAKAYYVWLPNLYPLATTFLDTYRKNLGFRRWYRGQLLRLSNVSPTAFQNNIRRIDARIKSDADYRVFLNADIAAMAKGYFADVAGLLKSNLQYLSQVPRQAPDLSPLPPVLDDAPVAVTPSVSVATPDMNTPVVSTPVVSIGEPRIAEPADMAPEVFSEEEVFGTQEGLPEEEKKLTLSKLLLPVGLALGLGVGLLAVMRK